MSGRVFGAVFAVLVLLVVVELLVRYSAVTSTGSGL